MKIWNKKILNKAVTFLLTAVMLCCNAVQVEAYTAIDGYPFVVDNFHMIVGENFSGNFFKGTLVEQNSYAANISTAFSSVQYLQFGNFESSFIFPYNYDLYDYYIVGTTGFECNTGELSLDLNDISSVGFSADYQHVFKNSCTDFSFYSFNSLNISGFSFSAKLDELDNTNISVIEIGCNSENSHIPACNAWFSASIVPVAKGTEAEQLNQSILNELIKINQNLVTSNSLQQSTIDAINQHDANEKSWFQQLIQSMGVGFSALYKQMTEEKDEQLYGYQDTTTSEAASAFSSESDKLTALEGDLSTQSNTYVSDYAAEGFDLGVLATIGSSLIFVTTWFTNFWNMGGVFTACLNFCFALSIVFFILRIKR